MTYTAEVAADTPDVYYRLGESSGTSLTDSSGNGATGTIPTNLYGGAPVTVSLGQTGLVGDSDTALRLGGVGTGQGGFVTPAVGGSADWYVEFVVKPLSTNWYVLVLAMDGATAVFDGAVGYNRGDTGAGATLNFEESGGLPLGASVDFSTAVAQMHVVMGIDSGKISHLFIDGVQVDTHNYTAWTLRTTTQNPTIQLSGANCVVDEFAHYDTATAQARFQAHLAEIPNTMTAALTLKRFTATSDIQVNVALPVYDPPSINIGSGAGFVDAPPTFTTRILDPDQRRAPTSLTVTVSGAYAGGRLRFYYDGSPTIYYSIPADFSGNLVATSIPVPPDMAAGAHTLTVETQSPTVPTNLRSVVLDFTLAHNPATGHVVGPDADPVYVEDALQDDGHLHWVLQDLMPGGLGSYVMEHNPVSSSRPDYERQLSARRATANDGQVHVTEGVGVKYEWRFAGLCFTEAEHEALEAWAELNRRFYIIDDFGEAWTVAATNTEIKPRKRSNLRIAGQPSSITDWVAEYSFTVLVYNADPLEPVGAP